MPDEQKPVPKPPIETPKDIEDLLKDLPKINESKPQALNIPPKPNMPLAPQTPEPPKSVSPVKPPSLTPPPSSLKPPISAAPQQSAPITPASDKFKSLIRTMGEDIDSAKKGAKPEPKSFEIKPPPATPKPITPLPPVPLTPSEIKLGPAQRTKALELPKPKESFTDVTKPKKSFPISKIIMFVAGIGITLGAIYAGIWYFANRQENVTVIPTLTPTPTPTPTPKLLLELIPFSSQITISSSENFLTAFNDKLASVNLTGGGWTALNIIDENGNKYTLSQIFERLNITLPNGILENLNMMTEWILAAYGQRETYDLSGALNLGQTPKLKLGLIAKTDYPSDLRSALNGWEITITEGMKNFLGLNTQKSSTQTFFDNTYNGIQIRYRNFPYADNTIDYAIVNLPQFNSDYLIIANSRESIYSAIDLLQTQ
jgi:hypothetical protein